MLLLLLTVASRPLWGASSRRSLNMQSAGTQLHAHGVGSYATRNAGAHTHTRSGSGPLVTGTGWSYLSTDGGHTHGMLGSSGTTIAMPPYLTLNYIIKQ